MIEAALPFPPPAAAIAIRLKTVQELPAGEELLTEEEKL